MNKPAGERWVFTMQLPADVSNGGRDAARVLKWLWRCWRVRCIAVLEAPPADAEPSAPDDERKGDR